MAAQSWQSWFESFFWVTVAAAVVFYGTGQYDLVTVILNDKRLYRCVRDRLVVVGAETPLRGVAGVRGLLGPGGWWGGDAGALTGCSMAPRTRRATAWRPGRTLVHRRGQVPARAAACMHFVCACVRCPYCRPFIGLGAASAGLNIALFFYVFVWQVWTRVCCCLRVRGWAAGLRNLPRPPHAQLVPCCVGVGC
jgi:hypothetical protein